MGDAAEGSAKAKESGDASFKSGRYADALEHYTTAISLDPSNGTLYSNRSACFASLEEYGLALADAAKCVELRPDWAKGYARKALAEFYLCRYAAAAATARSGLGLSPKDATLAQYEKEAASADAMPYRRGMRTVGWGGADVEIPFAISNSRVSTVFAQPKWPAAWPYKEADFAREDESNDGRFYAQPRLCTHIDDAAICAIRRFYALHFAQAPQGVYSILDICSSWISHYPKLLRAGRVAITGMNEAELRQNKQATEHVVKDLNEDPALPFKDGDFDFVTNVVSVDYLVRPQEIFRELHRVLKPGGVAIMSFSNRCFPNKAIRMWLRDMSDGPGHCQIIGNYFHFCPEGGWHSISSLDISLDPQASDPLWAVTAVKSAAVSEL